MLQLFTCKILEENKIIHNSSYFNFYEESNRFHNQTCYQMKQYNMSNSKGTQYKAHHHLQCVAMAASPSVLNPSLAIIKMEKNLQVRKRPGQKEARGSSNPGHSRTATSIPSQPLPLHTKGLEELREPRRRHNNCPLKPISGSTSRSYTKSCTTPPSILGGRRGMRRCVPKPLQGSMSLLKLA